MPWPWQRSGVPSASPSPGATDIGRLAGFQALFNVEPMLARDHRFTSLLHLDVAEQREVESLVARMVAEYREPPRVARPWYWRASWSWW
jgi:hypothetical protein